MSEKGEPKIKKCFRWISTHLMIINLTLLLISIIVSVVPFGIMDSGKIVSLLVIIATDFFIMSVGYLERIVKVTLKIDKLAERPSSTTMYSATPCNYEEKVTLAKNSIFFSGTALALLGSHELRALIAEKDNDVIVDLFSADFTNDSVVDAVMCMYGDPKESWLAYHKKLGDYVKEIGRKREVDVTYLDLFNPISYFAIDYKEITSGSFIQAKHYILAHDSQITPQVVYYTAHPGTEIYDRYLKQIRLIESSKSSGGKLSKRNLEYK